MRRKNAGVTLIELMITVGIVAILAAIAYPSYQAQIRKSHRTEGKSELMQIAQQLERCYTTSNTYAGCASVALPRNTHSGYYQITAPTQSDTLYTLNAAPQGAQAGDTTCGTLTLDQSGTKGSASADPTVCW